jgi:hypothetical protein
MKKAAAKIANVFSRAAVSSPCWEEVGGDDRGEEAVDREVEPLDGVPDGRPRDGLAQGGIRRHGTPR